MKTFFISIISVVFLFASHTAFADVVSERQANFSASGKALRMMGRAIGSGDFDFVEAEASKLAKWADMMPDFFPAGSESPKASPAIWTEFDRFTQLAVDFGDASRALAAAAKTGDAGMTKAKLSEVGATCQSCHMSYRSR